MGKTKLAGFALTFVFLALVLWKTNLTELGQALGSANYVFILPAATCTLASYALRTVRWRSILAPSARVPFRRLFPVLMVGFMANNVLPARLGELVRAYALGRKEGLSKSLGVATIMLERLLDGLTLVVILGLLSLAMPLPGWGVEIAGVASAVFLLGALAVVTLLLREDLARRAIALAIRPLPGRVAAAIAVRVGSFMMGLHALRRKRVVVALLALSAVVWTVETSSYFLVLRAFGIGLPLEATLVAALLMLVVVNLGIMLPSAPGYVGTFQFFAVLALSRFGVEHELALSIAIVAHGVQYVLVTGLGLVLFWRENLSFRSIQGMQGAPETTDPAEALGPVPARPEGVTQVEGAKQR